MKNSELQKKSARILSILTLIFLLSVSSMIASVQLVGAQTIPIVQYDTFCYIIATPNPVGIGQELYIQFRIDKVSPTSTGVEGGDHFEGFTVNITKPDGTIETKGPYGTDATSGSFFIYTPTVTGQYNLQANFPGQWINGSQYSYAGPVPNTNINRWYKSSTSEIATLIVQEEPIPSWPNNPLPTEYWSRPIYAENKGWFSIADNWLMPSYDRTSRSFHWSPAYAPYTSAPNSAHILWTKEARFGGVVGGQFGDDIYYTGLSYEEPVPNKLILQGRLIYTERTHGTDSNGAFTLGGYGYTYGRLGARVLDLYTGENIMFLNNTEIAFAQTLLFDTPNQHGVTPHLWASKAGGYIVYDAFTGAYMFEINNVPSGTFQFGPNGEVLIYGFRGTTTTRTFWMWNSTKAILTSSQPRWGSMVREEYYNLPRGAQVNGTLGYEWTVSIPDVGGLQSIAAVNVKENLLVASFTDSSVYPSIITDIGYPAMLTKDSAGQYPTTASQLWKETITPMYGAQIRRTPNIDSGVYVFFDDGKAVLHAYSAKTGTKLWSSDSISTEGLIVFSLNTIMAYGKIYISGYDGHTRAYNATTGALAMDFYKGSAGYEVPFGTWPDYGGFVIADNKVYVTADDHSPESILWRGARLWCVDAETGEEKWQISGMLRQPVISDGILVALNAYDGQLYSFGKGPSKTTVVAPNAGVVLGETVMITGSVLDQSPAQKDTACVSDETMSTWMEYLHMQKPISGTFENVTVTGVPVTIDVVDSNGNYRNIGVTTSDITGAYGLGWKPDISGKYTIITTFPGSNSYGSSFAQTYMTVDEAAATTAPTAAPQASTADMYFVPAVAGIIVAIIIVGAVLALLMFRKRP